MTRNKPGHRWSTLKHAPVLTQELQIAKLQMVNRKLSHPNIQAHTHTHAHEHTHTHAQAGHCVQREGLILDAPRVGRAPVDALLNGRVVALAQPLQILQIRVHAHGRRSTSERGMRGIRGIRGMEGGGGIARTPCLLYKGRAHSRQLPRPYPPLVKSSPPTNPALGS